MTKLDSELLNSTAFWWVKFEEKDKRTKEALSQLKTLMKEIGEEVIGRREKRDVNDWERDVRNDLRTVQHETLSNLLK